MSVESLTAVLHHSRARGTAKLVLIGIANHDGDGGAWPTVATLAAYAGLDGKPENQARTIRRVFRHLVALGELEIRTNAGGTGDRDWWERPNLYRLLVSCPPSCDRTTRHRERLDEQPALPVDNSAGDAANPRVTAPPPGAVTRSPPGRPDPANRPLHNQPVLTVPRPVPDRAREVLAQARATLRAGGERALCPHCHEWHLAEGDCP